MSYILDALKKSEQERGHGNIPDVQTVHTSSLNYRSEKKAYWPYILIAAVLLNLLAIVYFIVDKDQPAEIADTSQQKNVVAHVTPEDRPVVEKTTKTETVTTISSDDTKKKALEKPSPEPEEKTIEIKKQDCQQNRKNCCFARKTYHKPVCTYYRFLRLTRINKT